MGGCFPPPGARPPPDAPAWPVPLTGAIRTWLAEGERGLSSETIVGHLCGFPLVQHQHEPLDPDDLRRCIDLLDACPELRPHLWRMASLSPQWKRLVESWEELERTFREELMAEKPTGRTYALMKRLLQ